MPKMKTHKGAAKRFTTTGTGKITRRQRNRNHILEKKSSRRKRRLSRDREITHPEVGRELLDKFYEKIRDVSSMERPPAMEGRMLSIVVTPGTKRERPPGAREEAEATPAGAAAESA